MYHKQGNELLLMLATGKPNIDSNFSIVTVVRDSSSEVSVLATLLGLKLKAM